MLRSRIQGGGGLSGVKAAARNLLLGGAATALMAVTVVGSAAAAPITVTWEPTAVPGITDPYPDTTTFSTDDITTAEYGSIVLSPGSTPGTSDFINRGIVNLSAFTLSGASTTPIALGRTGGYVIYASFVATGTFNGTTVSPAVGTSDAGTIASFSYSLYIAPASGTPSFSATSAGAFSTGTGTRILLATGTEVSDGTTTLSNTAGSLSAGANVVATFVENPAAIADGFYVSPPTYVSLNLFSSTTNSGGDVLTVPDPNTLVIGAGGTGGGGDIVFKAAVPEPASIAVIGSGLFGLGLLRRRRAKR